MSAALLGALARSDSNSGAGVSGNLGPLTLPHVEYHFLMPFLIMVGSPVVLLAVASLFRRRVWPRGFYPGWTILTTVAAMVWTWHLWGQIVGHGGTPKPGPTSAVAGALAIDGFSLLITLIIGSAVVLSALVAAPYLERENLDGPEFYVLIMLSAAGGILMGAANDLVVVFLGLEILSLSLYVLTAYHRRRSRSGEAGIKYLVLGAFSSAFFLYGVAMLYGATGTTSLPGIAQYLAGHVLPSNGVLLAGTALIIVGLGFKVAAVPFHSWAPDVYEGAPTPATAYMAAVAKTAAFAALLRILLSALPTQAENWRPIIWVLAAITMIVGSMLAIVQTNVKRILAYSSVSHAGYVLVGLQAATATGAISSNGLAGSSFYLMTYTFMVIGSFAIVTVVGGTGDNHHGLDAYRGLATTRPVLALAFTILLLGQAGMPFTSGFIAKFNVISAVVTHGRAPDYTLGVIAMLAAVVSTFLYIKIIVAMYTREPVEEGVSDGGGVAVLTRTAVVVPTSIAVAVGVCVAVTVGFGIYPTPLIHLAERAGLLF